MILTQILTQLLQYCIVTQGNIKLLTKFVFAPNTATIIQQQRSYIPHLSTKYSKIVIIQRTENVGILLVKKIILVDGNNKGVNLFNWIFLMFLYSCISYNGHSLTSIYNPFQYTGPIFKIELRTLFILFYSAKK